MDRKASALWNGDLKTGKGTITTQSNTLHDTQYSFKSRFEDGTGTNPEHRRRPRRLLHHGLRQRARQGPATPPPPSQTECHRHPRDPSHRPHRHQDPPRQQVRSPRHRQSRLRRDRRRSKGQLPPSPNSSPPPKSPSTPPPLTKPQAACPAGRAHYAWGGNFVAGRGLRLGALRWSRTKSFLPTNGSPTRSSKKACERPPHA